MKKLDEHIALCSKFGAQKITMPKNKILKFSKLEARAFVEFCIFADLECFVSDIDSCQPCPDTSYTNKQSIHTPCSFGYKRVCTNPKYNKPIQLYTGPNVIEIFLERMFKERNEVLDILKNHALPLKLTPEEEKSFQKSKSCWICGRKFESHDVRVRDHSHLDGYVETLHTYVCRVNVCTF